MMRNLKITLNAFLAAGLSAAVICTALNSRAEEAVMTAATTEFMEESSVEALVLKTSGTSAENEAAETENTDTELLDMEALDAETMEAEVSETETSETETSETETSETSELSETIETSEAENVETEEPADTLETWETYTNALEADTNENEVDTDAQNLTLLDDNVGADKQTTTIVTESVDDAADATDATSLDGNTSIAVTEESYGSIFSDGSITGVEASNPESFDPESDIWKEFYDKFSPSEFTEDNFCYDEEYSLFEPYYDQTQEAFGAWHYVTLSEESDINRDYVYGCLVYADGTKSEQGWYDLGETSGYDDEIMTIDGVEWEKHEWSAYASGTSVVLKFDIDFYSSGAMGVYYPQYQFGYGSSVIRLNILNITDTTRRSSLGTLSFTSFTQTAGSSTEYRHLAMSGTITIPSDNLSTFDLSNTKKSFGCRAGGWGDDWNAEVYIYDIDVSGFATALAQATCAHTAYSYEYVNNSSHEKICSDCGVTIGTESHSISSGVCTGCKHVFNVSGYIKYTVGGKTYSEKYEQTPGSTYYPKSYEGYITPDPVSIPSGGGNVTITYTPITYYVVTDEKTYTLKYDTATKIAGTKKKGYTQQKFRVTSVS